MRPAPAEPHVVAVAADGTLRGAVPRRHAHEADAVLHLAVSVQLVDTSGLWLLQRRTRSKPLFAGRWANSCCTHPCHAESPEAAASRAVGQELGLAAELRRAGVFTYRAADPSSGLVEHERDIVFVGVTEISRAVPNAEHVGALAWATYAEAIRIVRSANGAPWAEAVLRMSRAALSRREAVCAGRLHS